MLKLVYSPVVFRADITNESSGEYLGRMRDKKLASWAVNAHTRDPSRWREWNMIIVTTRTGSLGRYEIEEGIIAEVWRRSLYQVNITCQKCRAIREQPGR